MEPNSELQKIEGQFRELLEKAGVLSLALSEQEKGEGRRRLKEFIAQERREFPILFFFKPIGAIALAIALFLTGSAGVVLAAQEALPGSSLYQVKMHVNERFRSAIALSYEEKAQWEIKRANLRLQEAEELSARGKFNAKAAEEVEEYLKAHVEKVQEISAFMQNNGKEVEAQAFYSDLEVILAIHGRILGQLSVSMPAEERVELGNIIAGVQSYTEVVLKDHEAVVNLDYKVSKKTAEQTMESAENEVKAIKLYVSKNKNKVGRYMRADIETQLTIAEKFFGEGRENVSLKRYKNSLVSFEKAANQAKEAKILLETSIRIKKDLNSNSR